MPLILNIWTSIIVLFLLIFSSIDHRTRVTALLCYECNSFKNPACNGNNLDEFKVLCRDKAVGCRKVSYSNFSGAGFISKRVARQCSMTRHRTGCSQATGINGKRYKQFTCECDGDVCNQSIRSQSQTPFVYIISMGTMVIVEMMR